MKTRIFTTTALALLTVLMLCGSTSAKGKEFRIASGLENAADPAIKVENWMVNDFVWNRNAGLILTEESDEVLELESWMTQSLFWDKFENASDEILVLEPWMLKTENWLPAFTLHETTAEETLQLEAWMTDNDNWR